MNVRQRQPRIIDNEHLAFIRELPCTICGKPGSDAAHLRSAAPQYGKRQTGLGEKPSDRWVLPLCRDHHMAQHHRGDELAWWLEQGIADPFKLALDLYESRPHKPRRERRERKGKPRLPRDQRRSVPQGKKLESRSNWPPKGSRKIPIRAKERLSK